MLEKLFFKLGLPVVLWCVLGASSASANVIYDYNYSFRFVTVNLEYSSPVYITTPTTVPLANLSVASCSFGCAATYFFEPSTSNNAGFDFAFGSQFPAGSLSQNGTYTEYISILNIPETLTVSGSPAPIVPEPASAALAASGLVLCVIRLVGRRRKRGTGMTL
jgi:hypothetical protein